MEPPIQTEYFLSGGATTLIFMVDRSKAVISFCIRAVISFCILSAKPWNMVVPPERTVLAYRSFWMSLSHFMRKENKSQETDRENCLRSDKARQSYLDDAVVRHLMDTARFSAEERRLKECLGTSEPFVVDSDDLAVWKFIGLFEGRGRDLFINVKDVAELLLDFANNFVNLVLGPGGERESSLADDPLQIIGEISSSQVTSQAGVRQSVSLIDGDGVRDTVTRVDNDAGGPAGSVKGQDGLDGDIYGRRVEGLEHDLHHILFVGFRVKRGFGEEDGMLFRRHTQLSIEGVMPDLLHVVPAGHDSALDWVGKSKRDTLRLGFFTDITVFVGRREHAAHCGLRQRQNETNVLYLFFS